MNVKVCKKCKGLYKDIFSKDCCPSCQQKENYEFEQVKEKLRECDINFEKMCTTEEEFFERWVREHDADMFGPLEDLTCHMCGSAISKGKYCTACKIKVLTTIRDEIKKSQKQKEVVATLSNNNSKRMHYLNSKSE